MRSRIAAYVPKDRFVIDQAAFACASRRVAWDLSVEQINEARRFFSSRAGKLFWAITHPDDDKLNACYKEVLNLEAQEDDYRALGLKVPKHVRDRTRVILIE